MNIATAAVLGTAIVVAAFVASGRYSMHIVSAGDRYNPIAWRIDRWNGDVSYCLIRHDKTACTLMSETLATSTPAPIPPRDEKQQTPLGKLFGLPKREPN